MLRRPSRTWKAILSIAAAASVPACVDAGCAGVPPAPPKEITCLIRAPKAANALDPDSKAEPGALECYDPLTKKGMTVPFEEADKYVCEPPAARREQDLYLKLRGL